MKEKDIIDLYDLMLEQLRDLYDGIQHKLAFLEMADSLAEAPDLDELILAYRKQTLAQKDRLRRIFMLLDESAKGEECVGLKALTKASSHLAKRCKIPEVRDASLITSLQHIHHYEMAGYGTAIAFCKVLDRHDVAEILLNNLLEDKDADLSLSELAEDEINIKATWDTLVAHIQDKADS